MTHPVPHAGAGPPVRRWIIDLLSGFTTETTPGAAGKIADYRAHLRPGATVSVTFLPGSDFADTVAVATRLRREGFNPVPHLAARSIPSRAFLEESLARLVGDAGVDQALLIGGGLATDPGCGIRGVHLYPLGGLKKSARWAQAVVDGRFEMREDGEGFEVDAALD